ncbi:MAG: hypothetical protein JNL61_13255 [Rhizobiaceae bacterium]|nr:hypothetical protein [Rhizobiaceae bacterium]
MAHAEAAQHRSRAERLSTPVVGSVGRSISAYVFFALSVAFTAGLVAGVIH